MSRRALALCVLLFALALTGCDYGRMNDQESVKTYERALPEMAPGSIPTHGGAEALRLLDPKTLPNPLPEAPAVIARGKAAYGDFCVQCHGVRLDGMGTVGQSFAPLPANLRSGAVLARPDGELFAKTRLGFRRHPPLAGTLSDSDTWAVLRFVRSPAAGTPTRGGS